jgi:hypothetical protein
MSFKNHYYNLGNEIEMKNAKIRLENWITEEIGIQTKELKEIVEKEGYKLPLNM